MIDDVGDDCGKEEQEEQSRAGVNNRMQHLSRALRLARERAQLLPTKRGFCDAHCYIG